MRRVYSDAGARSRMGGDRKGDAESPARFSEGQGEYPAAGGPVGMPVLAADKLRQFAGQILEGAGVPRDKAEVTAACLIASNLRGVDSHGMQLLPFYIDQLLAGEMDPHTDGRVISEAGSCLHFDGQNGIGQWVAETCTRHAVRIAQQQ